MSGRGFIAVEPDGVCAECGTVAELRPYGIDGARICFKCGNTNANAARTERALRAYLFGEEGNERARYVVYH